MAEWLYCCMGHRQATVKHSVLSKKRLKRHGWQQGIQQYNHSAIFHFSAGIGSTLLFLNVERITIDCVLSTSSISFTFSSISFW